VNEPSGTSRGWDPAHGSGTGALAGLRTGADAVVRAGAAGLTLAALRAGLGLTGSVVDEQVGTALYPLLALLDILVAVALVRLLVSVRRPTPARPAPVDDDGKPVVGLRVSAPVDAADSRPMTAVRRVVALRWSLVRVLFIDWLILLASAVVVIPLAGDVFTGDPDDIAARDQTVALLGVTLVVVLLTSFVAVVPQRLALDGDPRVLLAVAHSVRVSRTAFAAMFGCVLLAQLPFAVASVLDAYDRPVATRVATVLLAVPAQLLATAWLTEVFLRGPRLDVPADFGRRPR
jgi:hypothetical protein